MRFIINNRLAHRFDYRNAFNLIFSEICIKLLTGFRVFQGVVVIGSNSDSKPAQVAFTTEQRTHSTIEKPYVSIPLLVHNPASFKAPQKE